MNELVRLYKEILEAFGCTVDHDSNVLYKSEPIIIKINKKDKQLVLPIRDILRNGRDGGWDNIVAFHPACESIASGQSEIINTCLGIAGMNINQKVQHILVAIVNLCQNETAQGSLNLSQSELLREFESIDKATEKAILEIAKRNTGFSGKFPLLSFRLDRGGVINEKKYQRTCRLIKHILNYKDNFCGYVPATEKAKRVIKSLYTYILPDKAHFGSNNSDHPYLEALLECYYHTALHLNGIIKTLGKYAVINNANETIYITEIPLNWYDSIQHISKYAKKNIPQVLQGNSGCPIKDDVLPEEVKSESPDFKDTSIKQRNAQSDTNSAYLNRLGLSATPMASHVNTPIQPWNGSPAAYQPMPQPQPLPPQGYMPPNVSGWPQQSPSGYQIPVAPSQPLALGAAIVASCNQPFIQPYGNAGGFQNNQSQSQRGVGSFSQQSQNPSRIRNPFQL